LVWSALIGGVVVGLLVGASKGEALKGFLIGLGVGWFVSWVIGIAFEDIEYPLHRMIKDEERLSESRREGSALKRQRNR
jgi:hypothetical protein